MKKHLIIGGGVAGVTLAWQLIKKGHLVLLLDNKQNKSSTIAAGMINPIVFRRVTKSWRVDEFLPFAIGFYKELEVATGSQFFNSIKIRRFFASEQEKKYWLRKQEDESYKKYLSPEENHKHEFTSTQNNLGSAIVKNAFRVNAQAFMQQTHKSLYDLRKIGTKNPIEKIIKEKLIFVCSNRKDEYSFCNSHINILKYKN